MSIEAAKDQLDREEHQALTERERAHRAKQLLENPLLVAAFADIGAGLTTAFNASGPGDTLRREDIWRSVKLLDRLKASLATHLETGKLAKASLATIEQRRKSLFQRIRSVA